MEMFPMEQVCFKHVTNREIILNAMINWQRQMKDILSRQIIDIVLLTRISFCFEFLM